MPEAGSFTKTGSLLWVIVLEAPSQTILCGLLQSACELYHGGSMCAFYLYDLFPLLKPPGCGGLQPNAFNHFSKCTLHTTN